MLDPMLRAAIAAQLDSGGSPEEVADWLAALAPELGWSAVEVGAFQAGRDSERRPGDVTRAVAQSDLDDALVTLRGQMADMARLWEVQRVEIIRAKVFTHDKTVKAHMATAEQYRKHLETLRSCLPDDPNAGTTTVGDLMMRLFEAVKTRPGA